MAYRPFGQDWRSPGDKWVHTPSGWKRLVELSSSGSEHTEKGSRDQDLGGWTDGLAEDPDDTGRSVQTAVDALDTPLSDSQQKYTDGHETAVHTGAVAPSKKPSDGLRDQLYHRCVSALSGSRESNHYSTLSDAVQKLNFLHAVHDEYCFPFICRVVGLLYEHCYWTLSGTTQNALLKICEMAKDIAIDTRNHIDLVVCMVDKAITSLKRAHGSEGQSVHLMSRIKVKLKALEEIGLQVQHALEEFQSGADLSVLPEDCLRLIITHLSHPRDVVHVGMTCQKINLLAEENWAWKCLVYYHYEKQKVEEVRMQHQALVDDGYDTYVSWKDIFKTNYQLSREKFRRRSKNVLLFCGCCNYVFWKEYDHPCTFATQISFKTVTPEDFLKLFVW